MSSLIVRFTLTCWITSPGPEIRSFACVGRGRKQLQLLDSWSERRILARPIPEQSAPISRSFRVGMLFTDPIRRNRRIGSCGFGSVRPMTSSIGIRWLLRWKEHFRLKQKFELSIFTFFCTNGKFEQEVWIFVDYYFEVNFHFISLYFKLTQGNNFCVVFIKDI